MKTLLFLTATCCAIHAFGQQQETTEINTTAPKELKSETSSVSKVNTREQSINKTVTISKKAGQPQQVHDRAYYDNEIAGIDARIEAIDAKIAHVNATPSEKAIAEQNGWFTQMEDTKTELNQRRATLVAKRDNL